MTGNRDTLKNYYTVRLTIPIPIVNGSFPLGIQKNSVGTNLEIWRILLPKISIALPIWSLNLPLFGRLNYPTYKT